MEYYIKDLREKYGCYAVSYKNKPFEIVAECKSLKYAQEICDKLNGITSEPAKPKESEISLRDYFAAMAMQVLIKDFGIESTAVKAYSYADAMLAERSRTNE